MTELKVALVYDWLDTQHGGAEKVLLALHQAFPEAPLFTSVARPETATWARVFTVHTSFLQHFPALSQKPRWLLPFLPLAFESFDFSEYQVVISVTSALAKGVMTKPDQLHLCYLLTPPRYLYSHHQEYVSQSSGIGIVRTLVNTCFTYLKWWDQAAALRPDLIIPISQLVASRVDEYYHRQPQPVIYPPVMALADSKVKYEGKMPSRYALVVSRLVEYKRIDLAITACHKQGLALVIVGTGEEQAALAQVARGIGSQTFFLGSQTSAIVSALMKDSLLVLMPGIEDFGITAGEAIATGKAVIVHQQSGVAELITQGKNGWLFTELTTLSLSTAIGTALKHPLASRQLQQSMAKYATTSFVQSFKQVVNQSWATKARERNND